jgi:hypothetical protein
MLFTGYRQRLSTVPTMLTQESKKEELGIKKEK